MVQIRETLQLPPADFGDPTIEGVDGQTLPELETILVALQKCDISLSGTEIEILRSVARARALDALRIYIGLDEEAGYKNSRASVEERQLVEAADRLLRLHMSLGEPALVGTMSNVDEPTLRLAFRRIGVKGAPSDSDPLGVNDPIEDYMSVKTNELERLRIAAVLHEVMLILQKLSESYGDLDTTKHEDLETNELSGLSGQELNCLKELAKGQSNAMIGCELYVTEHTVKFHLTNVFEKLGMANRTEAAIYAYSHGLVEFDDRILNPVNKLEVLTSREGEIIEGVAQGLTNREISTLFLASITEHTVKFHLTNIFRKLGVANRTEAARLYYTAATMKDPLGRLTWIKQQLERNAAKIGQCLVGSAELTPEIEPQTEQLLANVGSLLESDFEDKLLRELGLMEKEARETKELKVKVRAA